MPDDIIYHYSKTNAIVGKSKASGRVFTDQEIWGSQATTEKINSAYVRDVFKVNLVDYLEFESPITIKNINKFSDEIFDIIEHIKTKTNGATYSPFVLKNDKIEPAQGYLFKFLI